MAIYRLLKVRLNMLIQFLVAIYIRYPAPAPVSFKVARECAWGFIWDGRSDSIANADYHLYVLSGH